MSETRKVVINACHGGYGLSWEAMQRLAARKGLVASYFPMSPDIHRKHFGETVDPMGHCIHRVIGPRVVHEWPERDDAAEFLSDDSFERDDPDVIAVVEEIGVEAASAPLARLEIVEIPADVEWEIGEYDGYEWVQEKHRRWP